jgi:4'-phosphopantetheinyl transferase
MTELEFADPTTLLELAGRRAVSAGSVQLWSFELRSDTALVARCRDLLSEPERLRADRFVFARDMARYVLAHAITRHILSLYAGVAPAVLSFEAGASGKPALSGPAAAVHLSFNLSHSHDRALLAVSTQRELGCDLEKVRPEVSGRELSERYFSARECAVIDAAPADDLARTFFRHWVAKEAVLKAQGVGLGFDLHRFSVGFGPDGAEASVHSDDPERLRADWWVRMLDAGEGWAAAVCAQAGNWQLTVMRPDQPAVRLEPPAPAGR